MQHWFLISKSLTHFTAVLLVPPRCKIGEAKNLLGCTEHKLNFDGSIVLLQRGGCYFSWKAVSVSTCSTIDAQVSSVRGTTVRGLFASDP